MPQNQIPGIPGSWGVDYEVVEYNGRHYIVYKSKLPGGKTLLDGWRISDSDFKKLRVGGARVKSITRSQFKGVEVFGDFGEIVSRGGTATEKPLKTWLRSLRETYGSHVSWINDREYMETFFSGYMEGKDPGVIQQELKQTKWYQSRTAAQRSWELDMNRADRNAAVQNTTSQVQSALEDLYGTTLGDAKITQKDIKKIAFDIASGKYGDPSSGFQEWLDTQTNKAEKIEGSNAWIDKQKTLEEQRQFMNRPEDMFEQIRDDALKWLGPGAIPDRSTLRDWSERLVSGRASQADWQQFMQKQAKNLYPWLGPDEMWQDRASIYKNIVEDELGIAVGYDHPLLKKIGETDDAGKSTGNALNFQDFTSVVRQSPQWERGSKAYEMGFDLFNKLNEIFSGVTA